MNAVQDTIRLYSPRFLLLILLVFVCQLAFIFWLSDYNPAAEKKRRPLINMLLVANDDQGLLRFTDQSLFAIPHAEGFSGSAWLSNAPAQYVAFEWTESPRWLPIAFRPVQGVITELLGNPVPRVYPAIPRPEPELAVPGLLNVRFLPEKSEVTVLEAPPGFRLEKTPELPSWAHADLLGNTVVQATFGPDGRVFSAVLTSGSGSGAADNFALQYARSARVPPFENETDLRWAVLNFDWHTIPPPIQPPAQ
jgi:hypothetical protein